MSSHLINADVIPIVAGYALLMGFLAAGLWRSQRGRAAALAAPARRPRWARPGWRALAWHGLATAAGGYLLLMAVVVGYYFGVAGESPAFLKAAFTGTALLIALAAPLYAAASWLYERRHR